MNKYYCKVVCKCHMHKGIQYVVIKCTIWKNLQTVCSCTTQGFEQYILQYSSCIGFMMVYL